MSARLSSSDQACLRGGNQRRRVSPGSPNREQAAVQMEVDVALVEQRFHVENSRADVEPITARDECMGQPFACPTLMSRRSHTPDIGRRLSTQTWFTSPRH